MDPVLQFDVETEEGVEKVAVNYAQVALLRSLDKAKSMSYHLIRKLSRQEIVNLGKPGRKNPEHIRVELLTKVTPQMDRHNATPSSSKGVGEGGACKGKKTKSKVAQNENRPGPLPGNVYAHLAKPCPHCNCKRVRVVNTGRLDGRNIMECTNRDCLATIMFTDIPEGTLINPGGTEEESSWYDLDAGEIFYPSATTLKRLQRCIKSHVRKPFVPTIRYDEKGSIVVRCPGQKELVRLL